MSNKKKKMWKSIKYPECHKDFPEACRHRDYWNPPLFPAPILQMQYQCQHFLQLECHCPCLQRRWPCPCLYSPFQWFHWSCRHRACRELPFCSLKYTWSQCLWKIPRYEPSNPTRCDWCILLEFSPDFEALQNSITELTNANAELQTNYENAQSRIAELEQALAEATTATETANNRISELESSIA